MSFRRLSRAVLLAALLAAVLASPAQAANVFPPTISQAGRQVTVTNNGTWVPMPSEFTYVWARCQPSNVNACTNSPTSTDSESYTLTTGDVGYRIRVVVFTSSPDSGSAASNATATISAAPPTNTLPPTIAGSPTVGSTVVNTSTGTWSDTNVTYTRQWLRCATSALGSCAAIPGATGTSYVLTPAEVGGLVRISVVAHGLGSSAAEPSNAVGPVQPLPVGGSNPPPPSDGGGSTTPTPGGPSFTRLKPFPVVVLAGRLRRGRTVVSEFVVKAPRRAKVSVRCSGTRCPFGTVRATVGRRKKIRMRRVERTFRAGQALIVRVTGRNRIGKYTRFRFRRTAAPRRLDRCLVPGESKPRRCS